MKNTDKKKKVYVMPSTKVVALRYNSRLLENSELEEMGQVAPAKDYLA